VVKGPVSWSRRIGPYVALPADREPFPVYLSAVCRSAATASLSGAGRASRTTLASRPRRWWQMRWVGALVLALTRGWYTRRARTGGNFVVYVVDGSTSVKSR
jgi:hypothetical protein